MTRAPNAEEGIRGGITEGVLAPLEDVNVRREEIPDILDDLEVYEKRVPTSCSGLEAEITELELYVGSDLDAISGPRETMSLTDRVTDFADDQAYSFLSDFTRDFIPFRSMVRRATGANAHDRAIRKAYRDGRLRRSYLKGIGFALGCDSPAAPHFPAAASSRREDAEAQDDAVFEYLAVPPAW
ncbi:MAG: hypothetical protein AAF788_06000 [Pseudomonadota bacterium]